MTPTIQADPVPLRVDEHGVIRVGDSRITLDLVVHEYEKGESPEQIVENYDVLELADVHGAIAYYLRHRDEVKEYIRRGEEKADQLQAIIEARQPPREQVKKELLARWAQMGKHHASPGE